MATLDFKNAVPISNGENNVHSLDFENAIPINHVQAESTEESQSLFGKAVDKIDEFLGQKSVSQRLKEQKKRDIQYKKDGAGPIDRFWGELKASAKDITHDAAGISPWLIPGLEEANGIKTVIGVASKIPMIGKLAGATTKASTLAAVNGISKYIQGITDGESNKKASKEGVETAAFTGALDLAVRGAGKAGGKVSDGVKSYLADAGAKEYAARFAKGALDASKRGLESFKAAADDSIGALKSASPIEKNSRTLSDLKHSIGQSVSDLKNTAESAILNSGKKLTALKGKTEDALLEVNKVFNTQNFDTQRGLSDSTKELIKKVGFNPMNIGEVIGKIDKDIQDRTVKLTQNVTQVVPKLKEHFNQEYDTLLKSEIGKTPVDVKDDLLDLANVIKNTASTGAISLKNKVSSIASQVRGFARNAQEKLIAESLPSILSNSSMNTEKGILELKDVHFIQKSLNSLGGRLIKSPEKQDLGYALFDVAKNMTKKADEQVGGLYSGLSNRYRNFKQVEDFSASFLGPTIKLPSGLFSESGKKTKSTAENLLKSGGLTAEEYIQHTSGVMRSLSDQASTLRENGLVPLADDIDSSVTALKNSFLSKKNLEIMSQNMIDAIKNNLKTHERMHKTLTDTVKEGLKSSVGKLEKIGESATRKADLIKRDYEDSIIPQIEGIKKSVVIKERQADEYARLLRKSIDSNKLFDYQGVMNDWMTAKGLGKAALSIALNKYLVGAVALKAFTKASPKFSAGALEGILNIEDKINKIPVNKNVKNAAYLFLDKIRNDIQGDENDN